MYIYQIILYNLALIGRFIFSFLLYISRRDTTTLLRDQILLLLFEKYFNNNLLTFKQIY